MVEKSVQFETETFRDPVASEITGEDWPAWAREKLRLMSQLKRGWDGNWDACEAELPSARSLKLLDETIELLVEHGLRPCGISPSPEGGGIYMFSRDSATPRSVEVCIDNDGDVDVWTTKTFPDKPVPHRREIKSWFFPHARREMVESIKIIRAFLGGEEIPKRSWPTNPAWYAEE